MADLNALKQKYAGVIDALQKFAPYGATLDAVDLDGEQLHIKGTVPSRVILERVWDNIKKADPTYSDLHHEIGGIAGHWGQELLELRPRPVPEAVLILHPRPRHPLLRV